MADDAAPQKTHRERQAGRKFDKKKSRTKPQDDNLTARQRNPRAFSIQSVNKMARKVRRTLDIKEKKHHIPVVDRTPLEPPPIIVAVIGPPKVGKTTLIHSLVKNFTRQNLATINGPVTIVSGKKRRITLIEGNNDINSMIDVAKVADLVLLLVDASFGFEMETFEFLNIAQVHGFPRIMGVLTHLDMLKDNKALKKTKKRLKHRFWTEVYQGAKLFYLSGVVHGSYQAREIHNLGRFISVMKFRPLVWRNTHSYILADRMEDLTNPEKVRQDSKCDRTVSLYGYVRGIPLKQNTSVHIPGAGDFGLSDVSFLPDPCPLPNKEKKRALNEKERLIYAPMSGIGGIVYDKDVVYVDLGSNKAHSQNVQEEDEPTKELVTSLIGSQKTLDDKIASSKLALFQDSNPVTSEEVARDTHFVMPREERMVVGDGRVRRKAVLGGDEEEDDIDDDDEEEEEEDEEEDESDSDVDDELQDIEDKERHLVMSQEGPSRGPKRKKMDLGEVSFADSDDDLEVDSGDVLKGKPKGSKAKASGQTKYAQRSGKDGDDDDSDEEEEDSDDSSDDDEEDDDDEGESDDGEDEEEDRSRKTDEQKGKSIKGQKQTKAAFKRTVSAAVDQDGGKESKVASEKRTKRTEGDVGTEMEVSQSAQEHDSDEENDEEKEDSSSEESDDEGIGEEDDDDDDDDDDDEEEDDEDGDSVDDQDDMEEEEESGHLKWKENLKQKAADSFLRQQSQTPNLRKQVYGNVVEADSSDEESKELGGLFTMTTTKASKKKLRRGINDVDCSSFVLETVRDWTCDEIKNLIADCFVTGKWEEGEDAKTLLDQDDELYGDFEDLETGEVHKADTTEDAGKEEKEEGDEQDSDVETTKKRRDMTMAEKRAEKKRKMKEIFDADYDNQGGESYFDELKEEMNQQAQLNKSEFADLDDDVRTQYEGFRAGMYVRVEIAAVPCEFVTNFDPAYPVILGSLLNSEESIGYVQMRLKKHRWYPKILKTRDPLIFSVGWRRFQTIPLYSIQDHNMRNRLLKYTPEHMHCQAIIWGPMTPQGTGVLAVQSVAGRAPEFRIAATGVILDLDKSINIVKKLKLTGTPMKIHKNTAFIQGMFNSALEAVKFEGASVRTVSGIRGQIKKPLKTPPGAFRATFEDKILRSDIVFVRTWYQVAVPKLYNPVTTLLLPTDLKASWTGMRTVRELRQAASVPVPRQKDSEYKKIERKNRRFNPLVVPRGLQKDLPFKERARYAPKKGRKGKGTSTQGLRAVVREPHERKVAALMHELSTLYKERQRKEQRAMATRVDSHKKRMSVVESQRDERQKKAKQEVYKLMGQMQKKNKKR